MEGKINQRM